MVAVLEVRGARRWQKAHMTQGVASYQLKELNEVKRAARPAPNTSDTRPTEFLYSWGDQFRIIKKTARRIYYLDERYGHRTRFVDRQKIECDGNIHNWLYLQPPQPETHNEPAPDLSHLKAEMAAAHPDRGGSNAAFIEARARYVAARRQMRR
jgi:hypothetical protein